MSKAYSEVVYTIRNGKMYPWFKGVANWLQPKGLMTKRFSGNKRQRRKKFRQFIDSCLDQPGIIHA